MKVISSLLFNAIFSFRNFYRILFVLITIASPAVFSAPLYCTEVFLNGLLTHGEQGKIQFERNAQLVGITNSSLAASTMVTDFYSPKPSCGEKFCRPTRQAIENPILLEPKNTFSRNDVIVSPQKKKSLSKKSSYGKVYVLPHATLTFAPRRGHYTIDELSLTHKSKLQLVAGEYWIGSLDLDADGEIEVVGKGTAILYVTNDLRIPKHFHVNHKSKKPESLVIYTFGNLTIESDKKINGFFYSKGDVGLDKKVNVNGAIAAANIHLGRDSKVTYAKEALKKLSFKNYCDGAPPVRDIGEPVVELDPFPYNTLASAITLTGKIIDKEGGARWLDSVRILDKNSGTSENISFDSDGRFGIELPLTSTRNSFLITAKDKANNESFYKFSIWHDPNLEFAVHLEPFEFLQIKPQLISGTIIVPEGTILASAYIQAYDGTILPLPLVGNRFSFYPPVVYGLNLWSVIAQDTLGNEVSSDVFLEGAGGIESGPVFIEDNGLGPNKRLTIYFYSLWSPYDNLVTFANEQILVKKHSGNLYEFSTDIILGDGLNRRSFWFSSPEGYYEQYAFFHASYPVDRIFIDIDWPWEEPNKTIQFSGNVHIPLNRIRENMRLVAINDKFEGIEYPIDLTPFDDWGNAKFSVELPLATGVNNLVIKLKKGNEDVVDPIGYAYYTLTVEGL